MNLWMLKHGVPKQLVEARALSFEGAFLFIHIHTKANDHVAFAMQYYAIMTVLARSTLVNHFQFYHNIINNLMLLLIQYFTQYSHKSERVGVVQQGRALTDQSLWFHDVFKISLLRTPARGRCGRRALFWRGVLARSSSSSVRCCYPCL